MTTNPYFRKNVPSEQALIESLTIEAIQINGRDYLYIPREVVVSDPLLGEGVSKYIDANRIEMYFDSPDLGFAPAPPSTGDLISRFGLEVPDAGVFIVSQRRFREVMSHNPTISFLEDHEKEILFTLILRMHSLKLNSSKMNFLSIH